MSPVWGIDSCSLECFRDCDMAIVRGWVFVLSPPCTHRHVSHGAPGGPVPLARFAEVTWLVHIIVVVVTELGVHAIAARTWKNFVWFFQRFIVVLRVGCSGRSCCGIGLIVFWLVGFWLCRFFVYRRCVWILNTLWGLLTVCSIWRKISFFRFLTNFFWRILIICQCFSQLMKCILWDNE